MASLKEQPENKKELQKCKKYDNPRKNFSTQDGRQSKITLSEVKLKSKRDGMWEGKK